MSCKESSWISRRDGGIERFILQGDALEVIQALKSKEENLSRIGDMIEEL